MNTKFTDSTDRVDHEIEQRVKAAYASLEVPDHLGKRIESVVEAHQRSNTQIAPRLDSSGWRVTAWAVSGSAISLAILAVTVLMLSGQPENAQNPKSAQSTLSTSLPEALVSEFATFVASGRSSDITSADPDVLKGWFRDRLQSEVPPDPPLQAMLKLAGGRLCQIQQARVASYVYQVDSTVVSLYITRAENTEDTPVTSSDDALSISVKKNHGYATWQRRGWRYSLVAELPSQKIAEIAVMMSNWQKAHHS